MRHASAQQRGRLAGSSTVAPHVGQKVDPATVALLIPWLDALPVAEVERHARSGTPSVREAANKVLVSMRTGKAVAP